MGFGTLRKDMKMGDMEMIDEHGVKATFKDDGDRYERRQSVSIL